VHHHRAKDQTNPAKEAAAHLHRNPPLAQCTHEAATPALLAGAGAKAPRQVLQGGVADNINAPFYIRKLIIYYNYITSTLI